MGAPIPKDFKTYIISLFIIGISPGICEEVMFRGVLFREYEYVYGSKKTILYTSFLFALFHLNIYNFIGPFILGIIFGIIRVKSGSIYPAMISHSMNNIIAMTIAYFLDLEILEDKILNITNVISIRRLSGIIIFFLILCILICRFLIKNFPNDKELIIEDSELKLRKSVYFPIIIAFIMYLFIAKRIFI